VLAVDRNLGGTRERSASGVDATQVARCQRPRAGDGRVEQCGESQHRRTGRASSHCFWRRVDIVRWRWQVTGRRQGERGLRPYSLAGGARAVGSEVARLHMPAGAPSEGHKVMVQRSGWRSGSVDHGLEGRRVLLANDRDLVDDLTDFAQLCVG
jgi:hypothetical protein